MYVMERMTVLMGAMRPTVLTYVLITGRIRQNALQPVKDHTVNALTCISSVGQVVVFQVQRSVIATMTALMDRMNLLIFVQKQCVIFPK